MIRVRCLGSCPIRFAAIRLLTKSVISAYAAVAIIASACSSHDTAARGVWDAPIVTAVADPYQMQPSLANYAVELRSLNELQETRFRNISAGGRSTCGVRTDGVINCIGPNPLWQEVRQSPNNSLHGRFLEVSDGGDFVCAQLTDNSLRCGGFNGYRQAEPPSGVFLRVDTGSAHACALTTDRVAMCWGNNEYGQTEPPTGSYIDIAAGGTHSCALTVKSSITCWGNNEYGQTEPPTGSYKQISLGHLHACALNTEGLLSCWGYMEPHVTMHFDYEPRDFERLYR